jgi:hypothetical protein
MNGRADEYLKGDFVLLQPLVLTGGWILVK